ncbi:unnamed protein product [Timema podura]|uniref:Uncharacterized protein n=1 Tax=Timema podura TaxID=61482 RepID=A0ABN7NWK2_TIMPD|nr:unnamed protein product [Timema podura]
MRDKSPGSPSTSRGCRSSPGNQQGQTALSIAQKLGYISVVESLKVVTDPSVSSNATLGADEKYRVVAPESMQETFMSDSEDEGGEFAYSGKEEEGSQGVDLQQSGKCPIYLVPPGQNILVDGSTLRDKSLKIAATKLVVCGVWCVVCGVWCVEEMCGELESERRGKVVGEDDNEA